MTNDPNGIFNTQSSNYYHDAAMNDDDLPSTGVTVFIDNLTVDGLNVIHNGALAQSSPTQDGGTVTSVSNFGGCQNSTQNVYNAQNDTFDDDQDAADSDSGGSGCGCACSECQYKDICAKANKNALTAAGRETQLTLGATGNICNGSRGYPTPKPGEEWPDYTVPATGMVLCHEAPLTYQFGTLTIPIGGFIRAVCTVVTIKARKLVIESGIAPDDVDPNPFHFEFLGDTGAQGSTGAQGATGENGISGDPTMCTHDIQHHSSKGQIGGNGYDGNPGGVGGAGRPNGEAHLFFGEIESFVPVLIYTRSGDGGKGGTGGAGGKGGTGGKGGNSHNCGASTCVINPQDGGDGGDGGNGGNGGAGGNGTNGNSIRVFVPKGNAGMISIFKASAKPGSGGDPGRQGESGDAGAYGIKESDCDNVRVAKNGLAGNVGDPGKIGSKGADGTVYGTAGIVEILESDDPINPYKSNRTTLVALI